MRRRIFVSAQSVAPQAHDGFFADVQLLAQLQQGQQGFQGLVRSHDCGVADQTTQWKFFILGA